MPQRIPRASEIDAEMGGAFPIWHQLIREVADRYSPIAQEWIASRSSFGAMCRLKHGTRTLLYMTPQPGSVLVAVVLGERSVSLALQSGIPELIKNKIREARAYAEGRGIRLEVSSEADIEAVMNVLDIKLTPIQSSKS